MSIIRYIILFFVFSIFAITPSITFAQSISTPPANIQLESINPGSPYYILKRLEETIKLNFLTFGDENKAKYSEQLFDARFKELVYAVQNKQTGYMENVSSRYTNEAGVILDKYIKIDPSFKTQAQRYLPTLSNLRDNFPANTPYWLMIQYSIDTTKRIAQS